MDKVISIVKINILSLFSIPILLLSLIFGMLGSAIRKIQMMIAFMFIFLGVIIFIPIIRKPSSLWEIMAILILTVVFLGILIMIIIACIGIITSVLITVSELLSAGLITISEALKSVYMSIIDIIRNLMLENKNNKGFMITCFMYFVMKGIYYLIVKILKYASVLAGIGSITLLVAIYIKFNQITVSYLGISLIEYINLYSAKDIILCAIILVTVLGAVIMMVTTLGIEWSEMAICLEKDGSSQYINSCYEGINESKDLEISVNELIERLSSAADYRISVMGQAQQIFEQYRGTKELEHAFNENNSFWSENIDKASHYMDQMTKERKKEKIIKLYWRIYYLVQGLENANKNVEDEINKAQKQSSSKQESRREESERNGDSEQRKSQVHELHFFMGCKDLNSLEERRKKLSKIYHPDTETGDTESFQVIMNEYERLKKTFPSNA